MFDENVCKNCNCILGEDDKYCQVCGTKKGEGKFIPSKNNSIILYGPITTNYFKCKKCKYKWRVELVYGGVDVSYCPHCGTKKIKKFYEYPAEYGPAVEDINIKYKINEWIEKLKRKIKR